MAGCSSSCKSSCGGCSDFSSKAPQAPSLMDVAVVTDIFRQAANNMLARHRQVLQGQMSQELYQERALYFAKWWTTCLEGGHPTYVIDEEWHAYGLPDLLREKLQEPTMSTHEVLYQAAMHLASAMHQWCQYASSDAITPMDAHEAMTDMIDYWAGLYVGAPFVLEDV